MPHAAPPAPLAAPHGAPAQGATPQHFSHIDALRGLAIIGVVAAHSRHLFTGLPSLADALAKLGSCGVQLFFLLSAFTLMHSWTARHDGAARFYLRRLARIAPMFWLAALAYFLLDRWLANPFWLGGTVDARALLLSLLFSHGWQPATINAIVPGGWSIAVEMNFYLLFPLLAALATSLPRGLLLLAASLPLAAAANAAMLTLPGPQVEDFVYFWLPNSLPAFMLGLVAFHLTPHAPRRWPSALGLMLLALALAAEVARGRLPWGATPAQPISRGTAVAAAGLLLVLALHRLPPGWLSGLLVNRATIRLGQLSYSVYLLHFLIIEALRRSLGLLSLPAAHANLAWAASLPLLLALTALPASLTYRWIEQPGIRAGATWLRQHPARPA